MELWSYYEYYGIFCELRYSQRCWHSSTLARWKRKPGKPYFYTIFQRRNSVGKNVRLSDFNFITVLFPGSLFCGVYYGNQANVYWEKLVKLKSLQNVYRTFVKKYNIFLENPENSNQIEKFLQFVGNL